MSTISTALVLSLPTCPADSPEFKFQYKLLILVATLWPFIWIPIVLRDVFLYCKRPGNSETLRES